MPAILGNTVLFKPSLTAAHRELVADENLRGSWITPGVINFIPCDGPEASKMVLPHTVILEVLHSQDLLEPFRKSGKVWRRISILTNPTPESQVRPAVRISTSFTRVPTWRVL